VIAVVTDFSCLCSTLASVVGLVQRARGRKTSGVQGASVALMFALALWSAVASAYVRSPYSGFPARVLLAALCALPGLCLVNAIAWRDPAWRASWTRWSWLLIAAAGTAVGSAGAMYLWGLDWVTGIGAEPVVVVSEPGLRALAIGTVPAFVALLILIERLRADVAAAPGLLMGCVGVTVSLLWVAAGTLWHGYITPTALVSGVALGAAAAVVWTVGAVREAPSGPVLRPSRRLVYGACVAGVLVAYALLARVALAWTVQAARTVLPWLVPAAAFIAVVALVAAAGSERWRHRLWTAIGRHFFGEKHDYGEVWIRLTELIAGAHSAAELLERTAGYCRQLLCVPAVTVWLSDGRGGLRRAAGAGPDASALDRVQAAAAVPLAPLPTEPTPSSPAPENARPASPQDEVLLTHLTRSSFACPLRVNGHLFGALAIGSADRPDALDKDDRRVVRYVSAQVASALGLYRLGDELADAREVGSFHRLSGFVIHDLKNLVAQQSIVLENAARFRGNPAFVSDALAAFEDSTNRMRSLITRLRTGEPAATPGECSCDILAVVRTLLASPLLASPAAHAIRLTAPTGVSHCMVALDATVATQLLSNLLVNALESLAGDAGSITVSIAPRGDGWQIDVRDEGRGIPEGFLREHLFRPFSTTKEGGLGIGLYQCKAIVEAAGGSIVVDSAENVGTTVSVVLPGSADAPMGQANPPTAVPHQSARV